MASFLQELQASGLDIIFSEALVRPGMQVSVRARHGSAERILQEVLAPHGLAARTGPSGQWLVVAAPRPAPRPSALPPVQNRVELHAPDRFEETVEVSVDRWPSAGPAPLRVDALAVTRAAGAFENAFRTLPLRPGVTPVNEVQSRFSVRSGGPDQNLTIVDGVEIYNPFRLEGLVAAFNPETVESFDLTTGVMPARYGDRLSSVLEVRTRAGRGGEGVRGAASLDLTSGSLTLDGPLPGAGGGSWLLSGRRTSFGWAMERLTGMKVRGFQDAQFRVDRPLGQRAQLSLWGLRGRESARRMPLLDRSSRYLGQAFELDRELDYRTGNDAWAATLHSVLAPRLSSTTVLSLYTNPQDVVERELFLPVDTEWTQRHERHIRIEDRALRQTSRFEASPRQKWEAGFEVHRLETAWTMKGNGTLARWSLFRGGSLGPTPWGTRGETFEGTEVAVDSSRRSTRWAAWLQDTIAVADRFVVEPGLRLQHSSINAETTLLPRLGATWRLGTSTRLTAAWGWHAQSPGFEKVLLADSFVDLGGSRPLPLASERSRQAVLGLERELARGAARVEVYDTRFDHLIVGRLEAEPERLRRLGPSAGVVRDAVERSLAPLVTAAPVNGGRGAARGIELSLALRTPPPSRLTGTLSYGYAVARRESYGHTYPFDYDRRHAVTLAADLRLGRKLGLSAAWRAASGLPYTPFHPTLAIDRSLADVVLRQTSHLRPVAGLRLSDLNSARHPFYSRLDVRVLLGPGGAGRWEAYLDVFNLLNHNVRDGNNAPGFKPSLELTPAGPRIVERSEHGLLIVPSFGLRLRF